MKLRPMGETLLDLESVLEEMVDAHDLQWGDVLALVWQWLVTHRPAAQERYVDDDSSPEFRYGPRSKKCD